MATLTDYMNRRNNVVQAPAPVVAYDVDPDATFRAAWKLTLEEWDTMTVQERAWHRWNVAKVGN